MVMHGCMITGVDNFTEYGYYYQTQAMATPSPLPASDPDPLLTLWTKAERNPIIPSTPVGGTHSQFRDPTTSWQQVWLHVLSHRHWHSTKQYTLKHICARWLRHHLHHLGTLRKTLLG